MLYIHVHVRQIEQSLGLLYSAINMGCSEWCKDEFKPCNFGFGKQQRPELTVTSQWSGLYPVIYLIWRWVALAYHLAWLIVSVAAATIYTAGRATWFAYLTNWTYFLLTVDVLIEALASLAWYIRARNPHNVPPETTTWYMKLSWFMYSMTTTVVLLVGLTYWVIIYSPGSGDFYIDVQTHGITLVYVVVNLALTGVPVRIYHLIYPFLFAVLYTVFTVIYYYAGGVSKNGKTYIYKGVLDWADPNTSLTWISILSFAGIPIIHVLLVYGLYMVRVTIHNKCCDNGNMADNEVRQSEMKTLSDENTTSYGMA